MQLIIADEATVDRMQRERRAYFTQQDFAKVVNNPVVIPRKGETIKWFHDRFPAMVQEVSHDIDNNRIYVVVKNSINFVL